jgi:hypothetical protein
MAVFLFLASSLPFASPLTPSRRACSEARSFMNILHDFYDIYSFDYSMITAYSIYQAVGRTDRTQHKMAPVKR